MADEWSPGMNEQSPCCKVRIRCKPFHSDLLLEMQCMTQHVLSCHLPWAPDTLPIQAPVRGLSQAANAHRQTSRQRHCRADPVSMSSQPARPVRCRAQAISATAATARSFPDFVPAAQIAEIEEQTALELASRLERLPVGVPSLRRAVDTAFVAPATSSRSSAGVSAA